MWLAWLPLDILWAPGNAGVLQGFSHLSRLHTHVRNVRKSHSERVEVEQRWVVPGSPVYRERVAREVTSFLGTSGAMAAHGQLLGT